MTTKKKIVAVAVTTLMAATCLTGCGVSTIYGSGSPDDYVKVGKYTKVSVADLDVEKVTKDDIQTEISSEIGDEASTKFYTTNEKVQDGDKVNIDYTGKINGKTFDGGSATAYSLEIGSDSFIDGFEDALIGKTVGTTVKVNVTFPSDYSDSSVAGKPATFTVKLNSITRTQKPTEEDYAKDQGYKSVAAFEKHIKKKLEKENRQTAKDTQRQEALATVVENSKLKKAPDDAIDAYVTQYKYSMEQMAEQYGMDVSTLIQYYGYTSKKQWKKDMKSEAKSQVKTDLVALYIAKTEDVMPSSSEVKKMAKKIENNGYDDDSFKEETGMTMKEYASLELITENASDYIIKHRAKK